MSSITPQQIIKWQNEMTGLRDEKGQPYSPVYLKTVHNQLSAIFNHAVKYAINAVNSPPAPDSRLNLIRFGKNGAAFFRLWSGCTDGYSSHSEADLALCSHLAFWTGRDAALMDSMFRQSGLMRDKWDRQQSGTTYGAITIQKAIEADIRENRKERDSIKRQIAGLERKLENKTIPEAAWYG